MNRDPQLPHPPKKFLMIIPPMANIPRHIHQRLLRQNLPVLPSPDLHHLTLIPDLYQTIMESPSLEETESVLAKSERITKSAEFVYFFEDLDREALGVHGHGCCAAAEAGAHDDYCYCEYEVRRGDGSGWDAPFKGSGMSNWNNCERFNDLGC
jgi:hypothetical protein